MSNMYIWTPQAYTTYVHYNSICIAQVLETFFAGKMTETETRVYTCLSYSTVRMFYIYNAIHLARAQGLYKTLSQGSERVGMAGALCTELPSARTLFDRASHILGYDLLRVCTEGPAERLHSTLYSQPAVVVSSLAAVERLYEEAPEAVERCVAVAGFSVGEITALIFSGAITFDDGENKFK